MYAMSARVVKKSVCTRAFTFLPINSIKFNLQPWGVFIIKENELWKLTRGCGEKSLEHIVDDEIQRNSIPCYEDFCNNQSVTALTYDVMLHISSESKSLSYGDQSERACYSCVYSYNGPGSDDTCVTNPSSVPHPNIVKCPEERECHVFQQYDKGADLVRSFQRGCNEQQGDGCVEDTHFITCNKFCNPHLCNDWDGTKPLVNSESMKAIAGLIIPLSCLILAFVTN